MRRHGLALVAAFGAAAMVGLPAGRQGGAQPARPAGAVPATMPAASRPGDRFEALNRWLKHMRIDRKTRSVIVQTEVIKRTGLLEFLICEDPKLA